VAVKHPISGALKKDALRVLRVREIIDTTAQSVLNKQAIKSAVTQQVGYRTLIQI
jgi:hypothetical protein